MIINKTLLFEDTWFNPELISTIKEALDSAKDNLVRLSFPMDYWVLEGLVKDYTLGEIAESFGDYHWVSLSEARLSYYNLVVKGKVTFFGRAVYNILEPNVINHQDIPVPYFISLIANQGKLILDLNAPAEVEDNNMFLK